MESIEHSQVNLIVDESRRHQLNREANEMIDFSLSERHLCDLELLATGVFSPLDRYMGREDYESVLNAMRLKDGTLWPIPICLDIPEPLAKQIESAKTVALRDPEGFLLAVLHIEDIWSNDWQKEAHAVYGTIDNAHPGVEFLSRMNHRYYIGGKIEVLNLPIHPDFKQIRLTPFEVKHMFKKLGWRRVIGFQTRNPVHRAQFEITLRAMRQARANLLLLPIVGITKTEDFDYYTRIRCYNAIAGYYPQDSMMLNLLPLAKRMAGPRDAILQAIISRNFGCTHFIIGRDHASPGTDSKGRPFYEKYQAQHLAKEFSNELGIDIMTFQEMVYASSEDNFRLENEIPNDMHSVSMSGSDIRIRIRSGSRIPEWATFPEVIAELEKAYPPPKNQGFTVFFTGLSGAGKSTLAKILYARFMEKGARPVTLLDGDIVRKNLSSNLGFSKQDRDLNVRRIGFVASEITKNRGIAICAPIAPYADTRREIRKAIEAYGGFIEVHVSTPIEICEKRDRKGMYSKARAGLIKGFTGVNDPYEIPEYPELRIDTGQLSPDEAIQEILLFLGEKGYL